MKQVILIHGGTSYSSYDLYIQNLRKSSLQYERLKYGNGWKDWLAGELVGSDFLTPSMPNGQNAVYEEWAITFEKIIPFFRDDVTLIGHSLGAMFLSKYLNDNTLESPVSKLILLAGGYDDESHEDLGSFKVLSAVHVPKNAGEVHLLHSLDDPIVPYTELAKFQRDMPTAITHPIADKGHFFGNMPTFPELLEIIES